MKIFSISKDCPAFKSYDGCGKALLITYDDVPYQIIYLPEDATIDNCDFNIKYDVRANARVYLGMVSCYEFVVENEVKFRES